MDIASIIGLVLGIVFVVISIMLDGSIVNFADLASVMITIGGTFAATLISYPMDKFLNSFKTIRYIFKEVENDAGSVIQKVIGLANVARKATLSIFLAPSTRSSMPSIKAPLSSLTAFSTASPP